MKWRGVDESSFVLSALENRIGFGQFSVYYHTLFSPFSSNLYSNKKTETDAQGHRAKTWQSCRENPGLGRGFSNLRVLRIIGKAC